jgi:hypothetical protein
MMDKTKLQSFVGLDIELDGNLWMIAAISEREALVSREVGGKRHVRDIDTKTCLSSIVIDESVVLDEVKPFIVRDD